MGQLLLGQFCLHLIEAAMAISMKRISNFIYLDSMRLNYILKVYDIMAAMQYNYETNRTNIPITYILKLVEKI
jgi:hypothetical protein